MKTHYYWGLLAAMGLGVSASLTSCDDFTNDSERIEPIPNRDVVKKHDLQVFMFFNEFVPDGGTLKVKGDGFDNDMEVWFQGVSGPLNGTIIDIYGEQTLLVEVPSGVKESSKVTFINSVTGDTVVSPILFRDTRNILCDFDNTEAFDNMYAMGAMSKNDYLLGTMNGLEDYDIPASYCSPTVKENKFGYFCNPNEWQKIVYAPAADGRQVDMNRYSIFGQFLDDAKLDPSKYVIKFEMLVPKSTSGNGITVSVGNFGDYEDYYNRDCATLLQTGAISWDKTDPESGWRVDRIEDNTLNEWMTVTIPLTDLKWNFVELCAIAFPEYVSNGYELPIDAQHLYYDVDTHKSHPELFAQNMSSNEQLNKYWGSLSIFVDPYDSGLYSSVSPGLVCIDNVRVVPDDGNGAIYLKSDFGKPSQHFYNNPRNTAFK